MPFFDRFWWLRAIGALLVGAAEAWVLWAIITSVTDLRVVFTQSALPVTIIVLVLAGTALTLAVGAARGRDRTARRRAAIGGNQDAVPRSHIKIASDSAADLGTAPLIVTWPLGRLDHPLIARIRVWAGVVGIILGTTLTAFVFTPWFYIWFDTLAYKALIVLFAVLAPFAGTLRRTLVQTYGSPRRLTLNAEGILWEPILGLQQFIRWHDARLLEVSSYKARAGWTGGEMAGRRYTLYTPDLAIWWNDFGWRYRAPAGDLAVLLAAISSRTGLVPRTFDPDLRVREHRLQINTTGAFALPTAHMRFDADAAYELVLEQPAPTMRSRIIAGAIGAVLSAGAIVAVLWALDRLYLFAEPDAMIRYTVAGIYLVFGGLIGLILLVGAVFGPLIRPRLSTPRVSAIRADATSLSKLYMQGRVPRLWSRMAGVNDNAEPSRIPWSEVASISMVSLRRGRRLYAVTGEEDAGVIVWSDRGSQSVLPSSTPPSAGTRSITAEELAALVTERSGKRVEVRRMW